ncbi:hypothetical protein CLOM_g3922 [Closterium sp. NIES-68]|nr:hypothetical protein CLOM_g3922 [Closterium sp. NIES-68]
MVDNTILILRSRYVTYDSQFGPTSGVHWGKARKELTSFTTIMSTHHDDLDFHAALKHMLSSDDWKMAYPNIVLVWIAVAVLPLSTVECERGFSRQNAAAKAAAAAAREAEALAAVEAARVFEEDAAAGPVWRRKGKGKMIAVESDSEEEEEAPVDSDTDSD